MFDTNVDTLFIWVAVGAVSVGVLGVVTGLPTTAPPDAAGLAMTVDEVATSPPGSVAHRELAAREWSVTSRQLGLRADGGTTHATLLRPIVPALDGRLAAVLTNKKPAAVFESPATFRRATDRAGTMEAQWRPAPDRVTIRRVVWGASDVTLVG